MDPDANISEQLRIAHEVISAVGTNMAGIPPKFERLAELVASLDEWIRRGGAYPGRWER